MAALYAAVGLAVSAWTGNPAVAALGAAAALLLLWLGRGVGDIVPAWLPLGSLGLLNHLQDLTAGLITTGDLLYFPALIAIALAAATLGVEGVR
jgi:ABC-2 type transport system permease protein